MASKSETGHARNVANFRVLIEHCATYGEYNPGNANITLPALQVKLSEAEAGLQTHLVVKAAYDSVTNTREILFKDLQGLTTRIMGALVSFDVQPLTLADAKTAVRKLRGQRAIKKSDDEAAGTPPSGASATHRNVSASQRSYDQQLQHFAKLVQLLQGESLYVPNETELTAAGLQAHQAVLAQATAQVAFQSAGYTASVAQRNAVLYDAHTGLPALARAVKAYVKSLYGLHSPQYVAIKGIGIRVVP